MMRNTLGEELQGRVTPEDKRHGVVTPGDKPQGWVTPEDKLQGGGALGEKPHGVVTPGDKPQGRVTPGDKPQGRVTPEDKRQGGEASGEERQMGMMDGREMKGIALEALVERDARAGHFVVDVIAGVDVPEALSRHFGGSDGILAEAERRGYLRGLNEVAEARMKEPSMYEQPLPEQPQAAPESADSLFVNRRRSIWG